VLARLAHPIRRSLGTAVRVATDPAAYLPDPGRRPTDRPAAGIVGFYGWGNYGDELFWQVFREHLGGAMELRNLLGPAGAAGSAAGGSMRRAVRAADLVLVGGGDLVIPWRRSRYWSETLLQRPVFIAGVGVPLWRDPTAAGVARLRGFFRHPSVRFVAARDRVSVDWIAEHLEPLVPVRMTTDLVCGLTLPEAPAPPPGPPIFGVAVRHRNEGPDDLSQVRALCDRAAAAGYRVRRIVLATGSVRRDDLEATARLGLDDTELVSTDDIDAISRAIGECRVFATMKFHGVIAAAMYGVTPIALKQSTKTRNFLADTGRLDLYTSFDDPQLPWFADRDLPPIALDVRDRLRVDAVSFLGDLRAAMLAQAAAGWGRAGRAA
jgi:polysaccharide pyruvyl transferase WcaK-like protein